LITIQAKVARVKFRNANFHKANTTLLSLFYTGYRVQNQKKKINGIFRKVLNDNLRRLSKGMAEQLVTGGPQRPDT
jgi:hypothetical protein